VTARNLLIVEDEPEWCDIYARAAERQGVREVKVAEDFPQAADLIDQMQFGVAIIDIGLDVTDDRNIDGLRVMEKIRSLKDETSILVVTGRAGADVLPITRDSITIYNAHIKGKTEITPGGIGEELKTGLESFEKKNSVTAASVQSVLKGDLDVWQWEDLMMRETGVHGGIQGLQALLDGLVSEFLPLIPEKPGAAVAKDEAASVLNGSYWSRAIGAPVVLVFGDTAHVEAAVAPAKSGQPLLGRYDAGSVLREVSTHGASGAVFALNGERRSSFVQA
jgi:CheY-like chemotaxis protein